MHSDFKQSKEEMQVLVKTAHVRERVMTLEHKSKAISKGEVMATGPDN